MLTDTGCVNTWTRRARRPARFDARGGRSVHEDSVDVRSVLHEQFRRLQVAVIHRLHQRRPWIAALRQAYAHASPSHCLSVCNGT